MGEKLLRKSNILIHSLDNGTAVSYRLFATSLLCVWINEDNCVVATIDNCDEENPKEAISDWKIYVKDQESGNYQTFNVAENVSYNQRKLTITYNRAITDFIVNVRENYTLLNLAEYLSLPSKYSMRLYELLKVAYVLEKNKGKNNGKHAIEYNLAELKLELGVVDLDALPLIKDEPEKDYQNILSEAVKELNEKTSLRVSYELAPKDNDATVIIFQVETTKE